MFLNLFTVPNMLCYMLIVMHNRHSDYGHVFVHVTLEMGIILLEMGIILLKM